MRPIPPHDEPALLESLQRGYNEPWSTIKTLSDCSWIARANALTVLLSEDQRAQNQQVERGPEDGRHIHDQIVFG
jgi:hypothetical protein